MTAFSTYSRPLPQEVDGWPRRAQLRCNTQAEHELRRVLNTVEQLGADVRLTQAVTKIEEARELVADWLEERA